MADEKKEILSPETTAKLAELDALKARVGSVEFVVKGKAQKLNLLDETEFKKAQQFLAGGATFAQDKAEFNKEREAFEADRAKHAEAVKAAAEKVAPAGASEQDIDKLAEEIEAETVKSLGADPDYQRGIDDGDHAATAKAEARVIAKAVAKALKSKPQAPANQQVDTSGFVKKEDLDVRDAQMAERVTYDTKVRPDPRFSTLADHLAKVLRCSKVEAEAQILAKMQGVDLNGRDKVEVLMSDVVAPWVKELDLKVEKPLPKDEHKETAPDGSRPGGGSGAGSEQPVFTGKTGPELDEWIAKNEKSGNKGGKWRP